MNELYSFMEDYLSSFFDEQLILKENDRGTVSRIRHIESHRLYICRRFSGDAHVYRKLLNVRCAHLPRVYEAAQKEDQALVLEEYIQGDTLRAVLGGGVLSSHEVKEIILQLSNALYVLHRLGLIHRDIKPENVIIWGNDAYLIDLDAARASSPAKAQDTQILGTMGYAPPEQYGISQTGQSSDIYAMGVMINEMLTGKHPSIELAPGRWGRIVQKCTMVNPKKRYHSVRALMEML